MSIVKRIQKKVATHALHRLYKPILAENSKLKDIHKGKRCFILGTGPSINQQDILRLQNEHTFVVNAFWNHPQYATLKPSYYVLTDSSIFPNSLDRGIYWSEDFKKHIPTIESCPSTELFLHIAGKKFVDTEQILTKNPVHYIMLDGYFKNNLSFNIEINRVLPTTKNVVLASIIIAVFMGFETIYLLGCEHSFLAQPAQEFYKSFREFYKTNYNDNDPTHIKNYAMDIMPYEQHIHHVGVLFKNYRLLKEKLAKEKPNVRIYNATPHSFLDVFPYIAYEDIVI